MGSWVFKWVIHSGEYWIRLWFLYSSVSVFCFRSIESHSHSQTRCSLFEATSCLLSHAFVATSRNRMTIHMPAFPDKFWCKEKGVKSTHTHRWQYASSYQDHQIWFLIPAIDNRLVVWMVFFPICWEL